MCAYSFDRFARRLRVSMQPVAGPRSRCALQGHLQLNASGALVHEALTKCVGKLGGGQKTTARKLSRIDEGVCKMPDDQDYGHVLLSKLFIHAAAPQEISSLEAWRALMDLPRALPSRQIVAPNAQDTMAFRDRASRTRSA